MDTHRWGILTGSSFQDTGFDLFASDLTFKNPAGS
ncbi:hypothetical protein FOQG_00596 [Fusarium oxysporum f. sp. raphani 54005]|uniref:Uncharacterized protein n=5 Tax=Fusarium oxysporum TaxID=5507 RepID=X0DA24_FUSOX|nr:hypothetical protein FOZG_05455 [Fusarium oxysporum Fo47]EWZ98240.1 hypothetical protein FOWG_02430 [Fusarium oxysporum f. sp. lycopersici MN25]EXA50151.1 hypothetical protein FOVG_02982 [Fusarium oxysporum f. sp. pisi HDV247]EXL00409.1 hypothetical protein FOQG_00596 [Fusarium oxysporum f. sp. raphani 54005]EXL62209.1 hypothetical protein FOCG_00955 [Fusarium oxysporum f. sp. radicis-lycopersici 26381]EXL85930.1 hypothetical protein FOPG_02197 [Fusarium oxysporum f. sp. conglutinans race 2